MIGCMQARCALRCPVMSQTDKTPVNLIGGSAVALALLVATTSRAEDMPAAVGRISYGESPPPGAAICTGVLVAPDLVLTAAHCVRDAVGNPDSIRFEAGWSKSGPAGQRHGAEVILTGEAVGQGLEALGQDVALVVLDVALPSKSFPPLPLSDPEDGPFALFGFDRNAPDLPQRAALCGPVFTLPGLLALDCPVVSGNSGAPLLEYDDKGWQVVAVMVASAGNGPVRSLAVLPQATLRLRIPLQEMNRKD